MTKTSPVFLSFTMWDFKPFSVPYGAYRTLEILYEKSPGQKQRRATDSGEATQVLRLSRGKEASGVLTLAQIYEISSEFDGWGQ